MLPVPSDSAEGVGEGGQHPAGFAAEGGAGPPAEKEGLMGGRPCHPQSWGEGHSSSLLERSTWRKQSLGLEQFSSVGESCASRMLVNIILPRLLMKECL